MFGPPLTLETVFLKKLQESLTELPVEPGEVDTLERLAKDGFQEHHVRPPDVDGFTVDMVRPDLLNP